MLYLSEPYRPELGWTPNSLRPVSGALLTVTVLPLIFLDRAPFNEKRFRQYSGTIGFGSLGLIIFRRPLIYRGLACPSRQCVVAAHRMSVVSLDSGEFGSTPPWGLPWRRDRCPLWDWCLYVSPGTRSSWQGESSVRWNSLSLRSRRRRTGAP